MRKLSILTNIAIIIADIVIIFIILKRWKNDEE